MVETFARILTYDPENFIKFLTRKLVERSKFHLIYVLFMFMFFNVVCCL